MCVKSGVVFRNAENRNPSTGNYSGTPLSEHLRFPNTPHFEHFFSATRELSIVLQIVETLISRHSDFRTPRRSKTFLIRFEV